MDITETLYVVNRADWRQWLSENHQTAKDIWLIFYTKASGRPFMPYDDAVEEALCFGWIDSIVKKYDSEGRAQRFSPRKASSQLSELNKERMRKMIREGKMTEAGIQSIRKHLKYNEDGSFELSPFIMPEDILDELRKDPVIWENFQNFPEHYRTIRIAFIETARERPDIFQTRLKYFMKMTAKNKLYGTQI